VFGFYFSGEKMKIYIAVISSLIVLVSSFGSVFGQPHKHKTYSPAVNFETLPPPPLMKNVGSSNMKITTKSELAQKYFNQGLNLMHAFWDLEAYRAFKEAARQDPNCAMAYWGIHNALGQNGAEMAKERNDALKNAVELMPTVSDQEKYYIRAISLRSQRGEGRVAWQSEMEALIDKYPNDIEAKLLLANSLSTAPSSYLPNRRPRSGKIYGQMLIQNVLKDHPNNVAANHYWIHAVENGSRPEDAVKSSEIITKIAPNSGHLLHMPGHIYYRIGEHEKARKAFLTSLAFDQKYMKEQKIHPINNWNYTHNLDYLVANSAEEGRYKEALRYAKILTEIPSDQKRLQATGLSYILYGGYTAPTRVKMRFGFWDEAIKELRTTLPKDTSNLTLSEKYQLGILYYLQGMSAVEKSNEGLASSSTEELEALLSTLPTGRPDNASDWYFRYARNILSVHLLDLEGSYLSLQGKHEVAFKLLTEGATKEKNLGYWEPPHYSRPVLESLGNAYIRAKQYDKAVSAFEDTLKIRRNSGFGYLGIARAYSASGNKIEATEFYKRFLAVWKNAEKDLSQIKEAEEWIKDN